MKVFKCVLEPHDFLFFVSRDLAKIGITEKKVIHSTALNYAVNYTSRVVSFSSQPDYNKDIEKFQFRVTPARPQGRIPEIGFSYNAVNDVALSTDAVGNYPTVGKYYKINLGAIQMLQGKKNFESTRFEFFTFSFNDMPPRKVIRLGKKDAYCRVTSEELTGVKIKEAREESPVEPSHPINPLEFEGKFARGFPITLLSIPPHLLILRCRIDEGRYIEAMSREKKHVIIPPKDKLKEITDFYGVN